MTERRPPTRDEVLAWMKATGGGYKLAAAHFGISAGAIKGWIRRAKQSASVEARPAEPKPNVVRLVPPASGNVAGDQAEVVLEDDPLAAWERKLRELERDMADTPPSRKAGLYGRWQDFREQVDAIRRERMAALGLENLPEEELRGRLEQLFRGLADPHLEIAVRVWQERVNLVVLPAAEPYVTAH